MDFNTDNHRRWRSECFDKEYLAKDLMLDPLDDEFKIAQCGYPGNVVIITSRRLIEQDPQREKVLFSVALKDVNYAYINSGLDKLTIRTLSGKKKKLSLPGTPGYDGTEATAMDTSAVSFVNKIDYALEHSKSPINEVERESSLMGLGKALLVYFAVAAVIILFFGSY